MVDLCSCEYSSQTQETSSGEHRHADEWLSPISVNLNVETMATLSITQYDFSRVYTYH